MDLRVVVPRADAMAMRAGERTSTTAAARRRVDSARRRMRRRLQHTPWTLNARVPGAYLRRELELPRAQTRRLDAAVGGGFSLRNAVTQRLGSAHRTVVAADFQNVGPSITYRLRDAAGQAREFHNFMLPIDLDGRRVFVLGVRETEAEDFRYLRIPADDNDSVAEWMRLRGVDRLQLEPLHDDDVRLLVRALHPSTMSEAEYSSIVDRAACSRALSLSHWP